MRRSTTIAGMMPNSLLRLFGGKVQRGTDNSGSFHIRAIYVLVRILEKLIEYLDNLAKIESTLP